MAAQGFEHLPLAQVTLAAADDAVFREVCALASALGKTELEVWTTDETPEVATFLSQRGFEIVRRYAISELDVASAAEPDVGAHPLVTLADEPEQIRAVYELALEAYPDQPGRAETVLSPFEVWRGWSVDPHPPDAFFVAREGDRVLGYGYLAVEGEVATHGFLAVERSSRGRGIGSSIKRAQIAWAKEHGIARLRTATELRLAGMRALNARLGYELLHTELVLRGPCA